MAREVNPVAVLAKHREQYETQKEAAASLGLGQAQLSDMLSGRRDVPKRVLALLGLRRTVVRNTQTVS